MDKPEETDGLVETATEAIHDHQRRRREIVKEWLDKYPQEWPGMRTALALELYGQGRTKDGRPMTKGDGSPKPSTAAKMAVKRDIDVIRVWMAAVRAHELDASKRIPSWHEIEGAVINARPEQIAEALQRAARGEPLLDLEDEGHDAPASIAAAEAIKHLQTSVVWLSSISHVNEDERATLLELVGAAEDAILRLPRPGSSARNV